MNIFIFDCQKSRNLGDWQTLNIDFKSLKVKYEPIAWPFLCLKRPFYGDFSGIFINYIGPKTAEKARCQFPWPLFWPCKFSVFKHQRHLWTALYNRAKNSIYFFMTQYTKLRQKTPKQCLILFSTFWNSWKPEVNCWKA